MVQRDAAHAPGGDVRVGDLEGHADRQRQVGEVDVVGPLAVEVDAAHRRV